MLTLTGIPQNTKQTGAHDSRSLIGVLFSILGMAWPFIVPYFIDVSTELGGWLQLGGGLAFLAVGSVPLAHYAFVTWRIGSRMDEEQS